MQGSGSIQALLDRYRTRLRPPEKSVRAAFCEAVQKELSFTLLDTEVSYSAPTRTIALKFGGPKKAEILLRKDAILSALQKALPPTTAPHTII